MEVSWGGERKLSLVSSYIGFLLGKKHSLVPENVIAVATTAGNKKKYCGPHLRACIGDSAILVLCSCVVLG